MNTRPFIIDCDTGCDDTLALLAALSSPEMKILGITSCNGNVPEKAVAKNNLDLMEYLGYEVTVTRGAYLPLLGNPDSNADADIHGVTGLGNITLPEAKKMKFSDEIASEFIYRMAKEYQGELEILVTGPLTNVAICVIEYPDFKDLVKHIYFMGGSTIGGNCNTTAEFNIWADPTAAHMVLTSGIPTSMVGLNVTNIALMYEEDEQELRDQCNKACTLAADVLDYMINRKNQDIRAARMHDPLALACALYPECLRMEKYYGDVETKGDFTKGHTAIDIYSKSDKEKNVDVAVAVDVVKFKKWLKERIMKTGEELR